MRSRTLHYNVALGGSVSYDLQAAVFFSLCAAIANWLVDVSTEWAQLLLSIIFAGRHPAKLSNHGLHELPFNMVLC